MPTIFVFTATGEQGRSTCKYLLEDGYEVVGLTRNPDGDRAKELEKMGVKVVKGDLEDVSSYSSHLEGSDAAFVNADFWATYLINGFDGRAARKNEFNCSKTAIEACVQAGIKHIVYSSAQHLPGYQVDCAESKADVSDYARSRNYPVTHLLTCTYFSNITRAQQLQKKEDGSFLLRMPIPDDCELPSFAAEQIGLWVRAALANPTRYVDIDVCSQIITLADMAKVLSEVSGKQIDTLHLTEEAFYSDKMKKQLPAEMWNSYDVFYHKAWKLDVAASKAVILEAWNCRAWAQENPELRATLGY